MDRVEQKDMMTTLGICADTIYNLSEYQEKYQAAYQENENFLKRTEEMAKNSNIGLFSGIIFIVSFLVAGRLSAVFCSLLPDEILERIPDVFPLLFGIVAALFITIKFANHYQTNLKKKVEQYKSANFPRIKAQLNQAQTDLVTLANSEEVHILQETIPEDYATLDAISFFLTAYKNLRVDTLKEAINLYEEEKYRREMQDMQLQELELLSQSVQLARQQLATQEQILNVQTQSLKLQHQSIHIQGKTLDKTTRISRQVRFGNAFTIINTVKHWNS